MPQRIAFVRFSPRGKSYAMRCDREDLIAGDEVYVLMYAGTTKEFFHRGEITRMSYQNWSCSCHVVNHVCEVKFCSDEEEFHRATDRSPKTDKKIKKWRAKRGLSSESKKIRSAKKRRGSDMRELYDAISSGDGQDAYLGDGVWISPDGSAEDRGR